MSATGSGRSTFGYQLTAPQTREASGSPADNAVFWGDGLATLRKTGHLSLQASARGG
jgi:hypothetical protein